MSRRTRISSTKSYNLSREAIYFNWRYYNMFTVQCKLHSVCRIILTKRLSSWSRSLKTAENIIYLLIVALTGSCYVKNTNQLKRVLLILYC